MATRTTGHIELARSPGLLLQNSSSNHLFPLSVISHSVLSLLARAPALWRLFKSFPHPKPMTNLNSHLSPLLPFPGTLHEKPLLTLLKIPKVYLTLPLIVLCSTIQSVEAQVTYCNRTGSTIEVAYGWRSHTSNSVHIKSAILRNGSCKKLNSSMPPRESNYYTMKHNDRWANWTNSVRYYCVDDRGNFDIEHNPFSSFQTVRDRKGSNQWNTCSGLGSSYRVVKFAGYTNNHYRREHRHVFGARVSRYEYYYNTRCTITFNQGGDNVDRSCGGSDSIKSRRIRYKVYP